MHVDKWNWNNIAELCVQSTWKIRFSVDDVGGAYLIIPITQNGFLQWKKRLKYSVCGKRKVVKGDDEVFGAAEKL